MVRKNINEVNPRVTPKIRGIVFVIPKLNPEYDATTLFGPGVKAATNQKRAIDNISGCIIIMQSVDHFQLFEKGTKVTFPSASIAPKTKTCETTPAIFFSGKLQTAITCLPFKFSSL